MSVKKLMTSRQLVEYVKEHDIETDFIKIKNVVLDDHYTNECSKDLECVDYTNIEFQNCEFSGLSTYSRISFHNVRFQNCTINFNTLKMCDLNFCNFSSCVIAGLQFRACYLARCNFFDCRFTASEFRQCDIRYVNFHNCSFHCTSYFNGCDVYSINFHKYTLESNKSLSIKNCDYRQFKFDYTDVMPITDFAQMYNVKNRGTIIGYKKAMSMGNGNPVIVKLSIPKDAIIYGSFGGKCRTDKAHVLEIYKYEGGKRKLKTAFSCHDTQFVYRVGSDVSVKNFDKNSFVECSTGIHFFLIEEMARKWNKW